MRRTTVHGILKRLDAYDVDVLELLEAYQDEKHDALWHGDPRLFRAFGRTLISADHPSRAFELIQEGLASHPNDHDLMYLRALALARGGNVAKTTELVDQLLRRSRLEATLKIESLSLLGRLEKDQYERSSTPARKRRFAAKSADLYERAHKLSGDSFPGINAASMLLLAGQTAKARKLARRVIKRAGAERRRRGRANDYWLTATLGEAHLLLGRQSAAASWYGKAVCQAAGRTGDVAAMRRQVLLLSRNVEVSKEIIGLFDIGHVVVFAGHMIDHPDRDAAGRLPRFPPDRELERKVGLAIAAKLKGLNVIVGYCSAACGSDILFAEEILRRGKELHVVLPFAKKDFCGTSVDFGLKGMTGWRKRFKVVLDRATVVHYATTEPYLGDDVLFDFVNTFTQGLAITHAKRLWVEPHALVVLDPDSGALLGGTAYFLEKWKTGGHPAHMIDLKALRSQITMKVRRPPRGKKPRRAKIKAGRIKRQFKAMLFADLKNFSALREEQSPSFFVTFLNEVVDVIKASQPRPVFQNTWGDGLYIVFGCVPHCADFAMRMLDRINHMNFEEIGLPEDTAVRIGLHAGPVYPGKDPIINRTSFFGCHVTRAARIEPVTPPGCVFTSEQFAATLAAEPGHDFLCEYVGTENLAKGYDRCPLYRLVRR